MMKSAVLLLALAAFAHAQNRPFYASRPVGVPEMLDQFKPADGLGNRVGADDDDKVPLKADDGIGGDPYLTPRLADFPKEHQPFWYLNSKKIMEHRGQKVPAETPVKTPVETPVETPEEPPIEPEVPVAKPPVRRPTGRRPSKVPVRPATPDAEIAERRLKNGPRFNDAPRRRPNQSFQLPSGDVQFAGRGRFDDNGYNVPRRYPSPSHF